MSTSDSPSLIHIRREHINDRERLLSSVALRSDDRIATGRISVLDTSTMAGSDRPPFEHDRDRIIHSRQFRKLLGKTQLLIAPARGALRTRLTHTLEVYQLATSIARRLNLNLAATEAIALGHDTGHTPFGHAGEAALNDLLAPLGGFHHAAHSVRTLDRCAYNDRLIRHERTCGLNLTFAVRQGILLHGWFNGRECTPFHLPPYSGLVWELMPTDDMPCGSVEAQVVAIADGIAYLNHDIDDLLQYGFEKIISERTVREFFEGCRHEEGIDTWRRIRLEFLNLLTLDNAGRVKKLIRNVIDASVDRIGDHSAASGEPQRLVDYCPEMRRARDLFYEFFGQCVYTDVRISQKNETAKECVWRLFTFFERFYSGNLDLLPYHIEQELAATDGPWWEAYLSKLDGFRANQRDDAHTSATPTLTNDAIAAKLAAADVVADMTDWEAIAAAKALNEAGSMAGNDVVDATLEAFPSKRQLEYQRDRTQRRRNELRNLVSTAGA